MDDWKRRRSGPQYMQGDGSFGQERPQYLRPIPPAPVVPKPQGIQLSEEAARKIADALRIFLHEPPARRSPPRR